MIQLKELISEYKKWKQYSLPSDKELLLYDFYVLSYLSTIRLSNKDVASQRGSFIGRDEEELKENINKIEIELFPYLKKELLLATFFSICCEIRHVFTQAEGIHKLGDKDKTIHNKYESLYNYTNSHKVEKIIRQSHPSIEYSSRTRLANYIIINKLMSSLNLVKSEFVNYCKTLFSDLYWDHLFGGKKWENICDAWLQLNSISNTDLSKLQIYIDHIYDLQHNTGSVLNKVDKYYKSHSGYEWIADALNFKANVKSPYELLKKCSGQMRNLANETLKRAGINRK